ncbi:type VII secretion protein EssB [Staphylococcus sp. IVB6181]|nr:type VII secretion protein EssB [Staphylococcus sp. IVB6181]UXV34859.1 type VII secretion protein EssB [Staphylococcus sp. IVB6181]
MEKNNSAQNNNEEREIMREIPKSAIKKAHYHLMHLLGEDIPHFLKADVIELDESFQVHYDFPEHLIRFDDIRAYTRDLKLRYLLNIAELMRVQKTRYTFDLRPEEIYFTKNGLPQLKTRGLKNIVEPMPITDEEFLDRYKALVICAFNQRTDFDSLIGGNLQLHKGTGFEKKVAEAKDFEELKDILKAQYKHQSAIYTQQYAYVPKKRFSIYKWIAIAAGVLAIVLAGVLLYLYFSVMKQNEIVEKGYLDYVRADYTNVLNDYKDLDASNLEKETLYVYARSYIETNKQGLEKEKKENLLNNITPDANKDYLLYWTELGQGHLDEALNIATYLDDNDITKLALINKLNEIKNSPDLSSEKRSEQTKKYNDKLQDILDKEKEVKDAESEQKAKAAQEKDEKLKQQEENEKKQKEQAQEDKEQRQKAERGN